MKQSIYAVVVLSLVLSTAFISYGQKGKLKNTSAHEAKSWVAGWPAKPKDVAAKMIDKYGAPSEATTTMLVWYNNGPWKKTVLYKNEVPHDFPKPHTDLLEQFIDYKVPLDKYNDLANYDGSVVAHRTNGELSARCDKEEMNFLALNLANDVATGKKTVDEARGYYARAAMDFMQGKKDPYTQGLKFEVFRGSTADRDMPAKM